MGIQKTLKREDCTLVYDVWPGERPVAIVLIHGYGVHRGMWKPQVKALQEAGYPVINMDVRGHGDSRPTKSFSVRAAAEDLYAILEAEQYPKTIIVGLSMGGFVTQEYAAVFGGALGYMVVGTTPMFMRYANWEKLALQYSGSIMKYLYTWKSLKKSMSKGSTFTPAAYNEAMNMFGRMNKEEFLISWQGLSTCLYERKIRLDAPLLVVCGDEDTRGTIKKHLSDWPVQYPGCTVKTIPRAGHLANLDAPETFNKILLSFIKSCAP
jgi:pimeloyl-ACP methyl ester carboxylesterase